MRRTRSTVEITKFAEDEGDEDFSDIFGATGDAFAEVEESDRGSEDGGQLILSRLSNNSWLGDDDDEDDPFALMDPGWDEMDLEANIARDRHARLAKRVEELVRSMKMTQGEDIVGKLAEDLVSCSEMISVRMGRLTSGFAAGSSMGEPRGQGAHYRRSWVAAHLGDPGALHREESAAHDSAAAQDRQCGWSGPCSVFSFWGVCICVC